MKSIFLRIFAISIASAIFISCSKENLTLNKSSQPTISTTKAYPVPYIGGLTGMLTPAPYYADLKFYLDGSEFISYCMADQAGHFKIGNLTPGTYHIMIRYIPVLPGAYPDREYKYMQIQGVLVEDGIIRDMGDIVLIQK
jgi:hypothetical protein